MQQTLCETGGRLQIQCDDVVDWPASPVSLDDWADIFLFLGDGTFSHGVATLREAMIIEETTTVEEADDPRRPDGV